MVAWSWSTRERQPDIFSLRRWQQHNGKWRYTAKEVKISNHQGHRSRSPVASNVSIFPWVRPNCCATCISFHMTIAVCFFYYCTTCEFFHMSIADKCASLRICATFILVVCTISTTYVISTWYQCYHGQNEGGSVHFFRCEKLNKWTKNSQVSKIELINLIRQTTH